MSRYVDEIQELVRAYQDGGEKKISLLEQAAKIADVHKDVEYGRSLRAELVRGSFAGSRPDIGIVAFAWLRAHVDLSLRDDESTQQLTSSYFFVAQSMSQVVPIQLNDMRRILDEMEADFKAIGYAMGAVRMLEVLTALRAGDREWAREAELRWRKCTHNCELCSRDLRTHFLLFIDEIEQAIDLALPSLSGQPVCWASTCNVPYALACRMLLPLYLADRKGEAEKYKQVAWDFVCSDQTDLSLTGQLLEYTALTEQFDDGIDLLEKSIVEAQSTTKAWYRLHWLIGACMVLERIEDGDERQLNVPRQAIKSLGLDELSLENIGRWSREQAQELADAFDARNGNSWHADWVNESLSR